MFSEGVLYKIRAVVFFLLCFGFGTFSFYQLAHRLNVQRDPAALPSQLSAFQDNNSDRIKQELSQKIRILPIENGKEKFLRFEGFSSYFCQKYPQVELQFISEGILVAGSPMQMKIVAPCISGQDPAEMAPIKIPVGLIKNQSPHNTEIRIANNSALFSFSQNADEWPQVWILKSVQFTSTNPSQTEFIEFLDHNNKVGSAAHAIVLEF